MRLKVIAFGHFRDAIPEPLSLELKDGSNIVDLGQALALLDGRLSALGDAKSLNAQCRVAVNLEYASACAILSDGDEVAFIPPMSGG